MMGTKTEEGRLVGAWAASVLCAALAAGNGVHAQTVEGTIVLEPRGDETVFTYRGRRGPASWADLDRDWRECGEGRAQSPVDLRASRRGRPAALRFDYRPSAIEVLNNGHTVEFVYEPGSTLHVGRSSYELAQFHFHTPSEHTFTGGAQFPVEMHLVHKDPSGRIAVVGIMLVEGEHNPALPAARLFGQMLPREAGIVHELDRTVNMADLLPRDRRSYRYRGSLTTPPCSEQVAWIVMLQPIKVSRGQLRELRQALGQLRYASAAGTNNRPTQPLNGRAVVIDRGRY